jgi:hypothetical protein
MTEESKKNISIQGHLEKMEKLVGHQQRFGDYSFILGYPLVLGFSIFILPLYIYMLIFSRLYFWLRNQKQLDIKDYYKYDRHQIAHLTLVDRIWCEYCEWANGTMQWTMAFANEVERRYCPIKNKDNPHCTTAKPWREKFLKYDHTPEDLEKYYLEQYPRETKE